MQWSERSTFMPPIPYIAHNISPVSSPGCTTRLPDLFHGKVFPLWSPLRDQSRITSGYTRLAFTLLEFPSLLPDNCSSCAHCSEYSSRFKTGPAPQRNKFQSPKSPSSPSAVVCQPAPRRGSESPVQKPIIISR